MQIIIAPDQHDPLQSAPPLMLSIRWTRLVLLALAAMALVAVAVYATARHIAGEWLQNRAPTAMALVEEITQRQNDARRELWEDNVQVLKEQIAHLRAETILLQTRGATLASQLGLPEKDFLPPDPVECNAADTSTDTSSSASNIAASAAISATTSFTTDAMPQISDDTVETLANATGITDFSSRLDDARHRYNILLQHGAEILINYSTVPMQRPLIGKNWLSSRFGTRRDPLTGRRAFHTGYDYAARRGTHVVAAATGVVDYTGRLGNYGKAIRITHGKNISTLYGHLRAIHVTPGDYVQRGQLIGEVGSTGRSTGPHLHYEVRRNNRPRAVAGEISKLRKARAVPKEWGLTPR